MLDTDHLLNFGTPLLKRIAGSSQARPLERLLDRSVLQIQARDSVHFGANTPNQSEILETLLEPMWLGILMKIRYENNFKDVTLYNGPGMPEIPVLPVLDKMDFINLLQDGSHPLETASALVELSQTLGLQSPIGRSVLSKMARRLSLTDMESFCLIARDLVSKGFLYKSSNDTKVASLLNRMLHLYLEGGVSLSELKSLKDELPVKVPLKALKLIEMDELSKMEREEEIADRAQYVSLLESVMGHLLQGNRFSPQPFTQTVKEVFSEIYQFPEGQFDDMEDPVCVAANTMTMVRSLEEFKELSQQFRSVMDSSDFSKSFKTAFFWICRSYRDLEKMETAVRLVHAYEKTGGDPLFLGRFLTLERETLASYSAEDLVNMVGGVLKAALPFNTPQTRQIYESVWDALWDNRPVLTKTSYPDWVARLARVRMVLPSCLPEYRQNTILKEKVSRSFRLDETETELKALFSGFETDPVGAEILSLAYLHTVGSGFARANVVKGFLKAMAPFTNTENAFIRLSNSQDEKEAKMNKLRDKISSLCRVSSIVGEQTLGRLPLSVWQTGLDHLNRSLMELARKQPPVPGKFDFYAMAETLEYSLQFFEKSLIPPERIGECFEGLQSISDYLQPGGKAAFESKVNTYFSNKLTTAEHRLQALQTFRQALAHYEQLNPKEACLPMQFLFHDQLSKELPENWPPFLEGFAEAMASLSPDERGKFQPQYLNPYTQCVSTLMTGISSGNCQGPLALFIPSICESLRRLIPVHGDGRLTGPMTLIAKNVRTVSDFQEMTVQVERMLNTDLPSEARLAVLDDFMTSQVTRGTSQEKAAFVRPLAKAYLNTHPGSEQLIPFLIHLFLDSEVSKISDSLFKDIVKVALNPPDGVPENRTFLGQFVNMKAKLRVGLLKNPDYFSAVLEMMTQLPGKWEESAEILKGAFYHLMNLLKKEDSDGKSDPEYLKKIIVENFRFISLMRHPNLLLNYFMLNRGKLHTETVQFLYQYLDNGDMNICKDLLPEAMAMVRPFLAMFPSDDTDGKRRIAMNKVSEGITRLNNFIAYSDGIPAIRSVQGIALNNWTDIATLGLSFTKWQYDSMKRWKGAGPSEKSPLLVQSGLFKPLPSRENDKTYHGGFYHYDPASGVSIEMRRACLVISKPGLGSLVIRNSSPVFGRDLLKEPAYYHPDKTFSQPPELFNPDAMDGFENVMGKKLNQVAIQTQTHEKIRSLLTEFEQVMMRYTDWKCGFKGGRPPEGFKDFLRASVASARNDGATSPFGKKKNIKLAWVNPYELPFAVSSFDVTLPGQQQEIERLLNILDKRATMHNDSGYETTIPQLLAFLKEGLEKNLELVLTEG